MAGKLPFGRSQSTESQQGEAGGEASKLNTNAYLYTGVYVPMGRYAKAFI